MGIQLPNNPAFKSVDLSGVTQAAQQSPLTSGAMSGGTTLPQSGGGNPSTSLYNAGTISKMGQNFANIGKATGQVQIPGPGVSGGVWDDNLINKGPGPGGIGLGQHDPKTLTQDQRQWLWEQNGHKGQAPIGYGGEAPQKQVVNNAPTLTSFLPSFTPPPSPVPSATMQPKSASGATVIPQSTSTGGGVAGQAFQALTQAGKALSGLGNITSIPASVLGGMLSNAQKFASSPTFVPPATAASETQANKPDFRDIRIPGSPTTIGELPELAGQVMPLAGIASGLKGLAQGGIGIGKALLKGDVGEALSGKNLMRGIGGLVASTASKTAASDKYMGPQGTEAAFNRQTREFGQGTEKGGFTPAPKGQTSATMKNLQGNLQGNQVQSAVQSYLNGGARLSDVSAGIASQEGLQTVNQMANQALKSGDMESVQRLATLHNAVSQQLNFINQIGQIVTALAAGFGTQNAPGLTEARMPMVQQGVGQALTSAPSAPMGFNQVPQNQAPVMPVRLPTVETQQNRPLLSPFMGV